MANEPVPMLVSWAAPADSAPEGAIPINLYGDLPTGLSNLSAISGSVPGAIGGNLQDILNDLANRLTALE